MNIKLHTPKSLKMGSGLANFKQFIMSIVATSISIVLTFGTAYFVDKNKKEKEKLEIAKMIIYDMDQTIKKIEKNDSAFDKVCRMQLQVAQQPEYFDSLRSRLLSVGDISMTKFSETTEKVFSTSIETFNTIGNANFVDAVTKFYINRQSYKDEIINVLKKDLEEKPLMASEKYFLDLDLADYRLLHRSFLSTMKKHRNYCMQLLDISEDDMVAFAEKQVVEDTGDLAEREDSVSKSWMKEYFEHCAIIDKAKKEKK
jgi:hypothetical protein